MDTITHAEALVLFQLPRKLGTTADGEEIFANTGRFGPYVKYGAKYVSLKLDDPYTVTLERALEVILEKQIADANRLILDFPDAGIQVLNGRYGPYITDKTRNAKIPKDRDPKTLTLPECQSMLAAAPARTFGKWGRKNKAGAKSASPKGAAQAGAAPNPKGASQRLAAKGLKSPAKKRAPAEASATPKPAPKASGAKKPKSSTKASPKGAAKA
jgi:DNA topoisomerase-1